MRLVKTGGGKKFARILCDVPCSATGVIRRRPDIKYLCTTKKTQELLIIQKQILQNTWDMLEDGGILLYCTCSILRQENEQQIKKFIKSHPDAKVVELNNLPGKKLLYGVQSLPGSEDGFYYAKLCKQ